MPGMPRDLPPNQASTPHENGHRPRPRWPFMTTRWVEPKLPLEATPLRRPDAGVSE